MPPTPLDQCRNALRKVFKQHLGIVYGFSSKAIESLIKSLVREAMPFINNNEERLEIRDGTLPLRLDRDALAFFTEKVELPLGR